MTTNFTDPIDPESDRSCPLTHAIDANCPTNPMINLQTVHPRLKPILFDSKLPNGGILSRPQTQCAATPVAGFTGALYKGAKRTFSHVQSVAETMEKEIPALVVMMDVDTQTNITQAIVDALDGQNVPRLNAMCAHRTGFKEMTSTGQAPQGSARQSARSVLKDLQNRGLISFYGSEAWPKSA